MFILTKDTVDILERMLEYLEQNEDNAKLYIDIQNLLNLRKPPEINHEEER